MFFKIFSRIIINAIAVYAAVQLVEGIDLEINFYNLVIAGLLLGIINTFIKPVLTVLSFPFVLLTFGLFTIIINVGLLFLMARLIPSFEIASFWSGLLGVFIISLVNYLLSKFSK
ncbi:MAG: phage holin family protein [Candidatus Moranbacteria bacterium]|nr:phage holin family protein [Candidatus Moranbacteria bacterium]